MADDLQPVKWRSLDGWTVVLILASVFLLSHPFTGIRHDGILYAGDALMHLPAGQFRDDLYFLFGSQGRFTLLPAFYATLIATFGLGAGTIVGLLLAFALYLAASLYVVRWLAPAPLRALCMLSVVLGWTIYGGNRIFAYSEAFLTARSFAEPFVLLMVGLMVRGRLIAAAVALGIALLIHPLIASCGLVVFWLFLVQRDGQWLWLLPVALVALVALGLFGGGPFADVFARYDERWLALVQEANSHAFVLHWSALDFGVIVFDLACLWFAHRQAGNETLRRLIVAVVMAGVGCTAASLLLVDVLQSPFFGKLQIWRALWLMQWVALASLPISLVALWRRDATGRIAAALLLIGWMACFNVAAGPVAIIAVLVELARRRIVVSRPTLLIVFVAVAIVAASIVAQFEVRVFKVGLMLDKPLRDLVAQSLGANVLLAALAVALLFWRRRFGRLAPLIALVAFGGSLALWDQRGAWTRTLEARPVGEHIWPGVIEPGAKVYWYRDMIAPWILLGRANYYTQQQASGAVFSRAMIVELDRRSQITAMLDMQEQICRMMNGLNGKQDSCEPDAQATRTICTNGGIDYVVLESTLQGMKPLASYDAGVVENGYEKRFFLYRCAAL